MMRAFHLCNKNSMLECVDVSWLVETGGIFEIYTIVYSKCMYVLTLIMVYT
jgi:hypothetical protein